VNTANTDNIKQAVQTRPTDQQVKQVVAALAPKFTSFVDAWR
jgi:hypothetical protein